VIPVRKARAAARRAVLVPVWFFTSLFVMRYDRVVPDSGRITVTVCCGLQFDWMSVISGHSTGVLSIL
jgi:hypothetical protein